MTEFFNTRESVESAGLKRGYRSDQVVIITLRLGRWDERFMYFSVAFLVLAGFAFGFAAKQGAQIAKP